MVSLFIRYTAKLMGADVWEAWGRGPVLVCLGVKAWLVRALQNSVFLCENKSCMKKRKIKSSRAEERY